LFFKIIQKLKFQINDLAKDINKNVNGTKNKIKISHHYILGITKENNFENNKKPNITINKINCHKSFLSIFFIIFLINCLINLQ